MHGRAGGRSRPPACSHNYLPRSCTTVVRFTFLDSPCIWVSRVGGMRRPRTAIRALIEQNARRPFVRAIRSTLDRFRLSVLSQIEEAT
jgi:hypothetical protein